MSYRHCHHLNAILLRQKYYSNYKVYISHVNARSIEYINKLFRSVGRCQYLSNFSPRSCFDLLLYISNCTQCLLSYLPSSIAGALFTKLMWLGLSPLLDKIACQEVLVLGARVAVSESAHDFGVVIDRELTLTAHVAAVCQSGYHLLRQLRPIVRSLSVHATKTLVQAFISCRLDYCNSLLYGISDGLLRRLQSVQNAAARLVSGARRRDHITPVLQQLHWLPVRQGIVLKVAGLVHQSLAGVTPAYLADDCCVLSNAGRRPLRSDSNELRNLLVPRTHSKLGDRSFSVAGPRMWNDLPPRLRRPGLSFDTFKQSLKTYLFGDRSA